MTTFRHGRYPLGWRVPDCDFETLEIIMRIGIFGGSFDPVHVGHLIAAECAREQAGLDRVVFVPAATPPHKPGRILADGRQRLEMLALAIGGHDAFAVSPVELDRGGTSYTVDTLTALTAAHPDDRLVLLLGPDAVAGLPTWREPKQIAALAEIVPVERESLDDLATTVAHGGLADLLGPEATAALLARRVRMPAVGIRATDLRAAVAAGRSIRYRTPRGVERFIATHGLYQ
jgi:nicotinate-nucleotide adenylyltransferase